MAAHARAAIAAAPFAYPVIGKPVVACGEGKKGGRELMHAMPIVSLA